MSDETAENMPLSPAEPPQIKAPPIGECLRAAREACGMSVAEVAQALKLSMRQIEAMESGDWSRLPGRTLIRGFVRNYARLLQLDGDELLTHIDLTDLPGLPPLNISAGTKATLPQPGKAHRKDFLVVLGGLALLAVALLAYFFVPTDFWQMKLQEKALVENRAPDNNAKLEAPEAASPPISVAPQLVPAAPVAPDVPPATTSAPTASAPVTVTTPGRGALTLKFSEAAWTEIRDRSGQVLLSQLNPAGSERQLEGLPPFTLIIGNAAHVSVFYNGKPVDLAPRSQGDVARLTLE